MHIHQQLSQALLDIGLTEAEVKVYIELHRKPSQTIWELVTRTGLSKSATYRAFDRLRHLKMVANDSGGIHALSLKSLVAELSGRERKLKKSVSKLKAIAPYLRTAKEPIEVFETLYTPDQISDAYLFMSEADYDMSLDFGDFENFVPTIGGVQTSFQYRRNRIKHAGHHAICTTFGPNTSYFCTKEAAKRFKNKIDVSNLEFKNKFIVFSNASDYVLFNHFEDLENPYSVLIKSKPIADAQRAQFDIISQKIGKD
ncbi:MAG: helix-turn-helix domain-containing protein [Candidatus Peribacteraceae bacterium]